MSTWQQPAAKKPRPVLTYVAAAIMVAGLIASLPFLRQLNQAIPGPPAPVDGRPITLPGVGLTIFSTTKNAGQSCTAKDVRGNPIALKEPSRHEQWDAGPMYYVVAHSVDKVPAQTVDVACTNTDAAYFVGKRHTADVFVTPALSALAAFFGPALLGIVLIVVDQRRRRTEA